MSLYVEQTRSYVGAFGEIYAAVAGAVGGLEGKVIKSDAAAGALEAKFDKKILGKVLGDRTHILVTVSASNETECLVKIEAYPLDAVGRRLMFGARNGVTETVVAWFWAHLEHRLGKLV
jgi:hypothetical protein